MTKQTTVSLRTKTSTQQAMVTLPLTKLIRKYLKGNLNLNYIDSLHLLFSYGQLLLVLIPLFLMC